ncbi:aldo/keto reductase [Streptomyces sp. NBC_00576]|uniref:aldo/keto reductase n=1 Tax=Streptomyces sp. NBC_00576 TaxID=2903665 RepID=UPI002E7FBE90|nr:aldo/keto reductase [Streptomyces sp. NBC_00576]WUB69789.1 aldo/keto reductase [Streptomyces sp. NBC_00576]
MKPVLRERLSVTGQVPNVSLNNGVQMPILGFGVFQIPEDQTQQTVEAALEAGYRLLDTAAAYENERAVGRAIAAGGIAREIGATPGQVALARAADQSSVAAPVVGARTLSHLTDNLGAAELHLDADTTAALNTVSAPQHGGYPYGGFGTAQRSRDPPRQQSPGEPHRRRKRRTSRSRIAAPDGSTYALTLRLDGHLMHAISDETLISTWSCPVSRDQLPSLRSIRTAGGHFPAPVLPTGVSWSRSSSRTPTSASSMKAKRSPSRRGGIPTLSARSGSHPNARTARKPQAS